MRTRSSKLTEDAAESEGTPESKTDVGKTMNVDVIAEESPSEAIEESPQNHSSLETPGASVPEETSFKNDSSSSSHHLDLDSAVSEAPDQGGKNIGKDVSDSVRTEGGATPVASTEEVASDSITPEEGISSNISQTVEGASGSVKMGDAPSLTTSSAVEGDASKMGHTSAESVAKPVVCSSEKSVAAEEMTADALTIETDSGSTTVRNAVTKSPKASVQIEGSDSGSDSDTTNMEGTPEKSIDSGKDNEASVKTKSEVDPESLKKKTDKRTPEEKRAERKCINETRAQFKIIGRKLCEERNIPFPNQASFKNIIYDLYKNKKLDEKNLGIKLEEAAQRKVNASAGPMGIETLEKVTGDTKEEGELSTSSGSDVDPESPAKSISENEAVQREVEAKYEKYRDIGVKYCASKQLRVPRWMRFRKIMSELASKQQLNITELKAALDVHGRLLREESILLGARKIKPRLDAKGEIIPPVVKKIGKMTTEERVAFFEEFNTLKETMIPIAIRHCHTIKAPFPAIRHFNVICRDLFDIGMLDEKNIKLEIERYFEDQCNIPLTDERINAILRRYCADNGIDNITMKRRKAEILSKMPQELLSQKHFWNVMYDAQKTNLFLNEPYLEAAKKSTSEDSKPTNAAKNDRQGKVEIEEMTTGERITFFEKLKTLKATMKPIAIKHCHTIKAPFPAIKRYNTMCKDLFEIGMLDVKNIKLAVEKDFEERCKAPLNDEQISFVLKRYCEDNGFFDMGMKRMKAEILPEMPQELLCQRHFWNVMYEEQKTNLFLNELHGEGTKNTDEITPSVVKKIEEMTTGECIAFFEELKTLKETVKPIAIKHCHTIKAPFPAVKRYNNMCKDLLEVGMLDEVNIKLAVERDFEKRCNLPLNDEQITYVLKRYCADNGLFDMSVKRMKAEILPEMPKELLCQKHYWNVMYEEQKTNLFQNKPNLEAARKSTPEDSTPSSAAKSDMPGEGANKTKPRLGAKSEMKRSIVNNIEEMTTGELVAFFEKLKTLKATMKPIAIRHCHTIKAPLPGVKHFNKICKDLFEVGMLDEVNIKLAVEKDFEKRCKLPLNDEQICFLLKRYCADKGIVDIGIKRMKAEILPEMPKKLLCQKHYWNVMYEEQKTNLFQNEPNIEAAKKSTLEGSKPSSVASRVQKTGGVATKPESKQANQELITPPRRIWQRKRRMVQDGNNQSENLLAVGPSKKLSKMTEYSRDRYDRGPRNASSSAATRNAASSTYMNTSSRRLDEEPIHQLLHTQRWIAEKARMLGGLYSQESVVSQSLPSLKGLLQEHSKSPWGKNQEQWGKGLNLQAQRDYSQSQPRVQGAMNVPDRFPSVPIYPPAQSYFPERNLSAQNVVIANFTSHTNISGAFGGQSFSSAQPTWPNEPRMENRGRYSAGMPKDDYSRNSGFADSYGHQGTGLGSRPQGRDYEHLVERTSERGWSERDQFSPPRQNKTNWDRDDLRRGSNELKRVGELLELNPPPPPIISTVVGKPAVWNSQEQSRRYNDDDDWRLVRGAPPQKKSRFDEDRQPQPSQSVDLQRAVNELQSRFAEGNSMSSEPLNPSTFSRRSWGQASPPRIGDQSKPLMMKENPPFVARGKTCKVAIVHEDYPRRRVTDQEANLIRTALLERIGVQSDVGPRFSHTYQERGAVIFECEDQLTVTWLWVNASTIIPWRTVKLRPTSWENPGKEISIYVPDLLASLTPEALCERLMRQNPSLSTESWKFKSTDSTSFKGLIFDFYIDDESMKNLKSLDFRPYLGFSRVMVYVNQE